MKQQFHNIVAETKGNKLVLTVDMTRTVGMSSSGDNEMIAKTGGNQPIALPDGRVAKLGLNFYVKP